MKSKKNLIKKSREKTPYSGSMVLAVLSRLITLLVSITVIYPTIFICLISLKDNKEVFSNIWGLPEVLRWSNYTYAWIEGKLSLYAINSVIVSVLAVLTATILSAFAGYALSKMHIPKSNLILSILMGFNFIPGVTIYISLYQQMISMGLNRTLWMLILPYMAWQIPFSVFIFKKFFDSIPSELLEAARVDGSSEVNTFFKVVLPLVYPAVATVMVFGFINTWGEYMWASIAASSSIAIQTLPVGLLHFRGDYGIEWGPFAAAIIIIIIPLMLLFVYLQRYFIQGLTSGAVKG